MPIRAFCHDSDSEVLFSGYRELEMSTYGTLVSVQWSRLSIFKEVTTIVRWLMARVFLAETKSNILENTLKIPKNVKTKIGMSVVFQMHNSVHCGRVY